MASTYGTEYTLYTTSRGVCRRSSGKPHVDLPHHNVLEIPQSTHKLFIFTGVHSPFPSPLSRRSTSAIGHRDCWTPVEYVLISYTSFPPTVDPPETSLSHSRTAKIDFALPQNRLCVLRSKRERRRFARCLSLHQSVVVVGGIEER